MGVGGGSVRGGGGRGDQLRGGGGRGVSKGVGVGGDQ